MRVSTGLVLVAVLSVSATAAAQSHPAGGTDAAAHAAPSAHPPAAGEATHADTHDQQAQGKGPSAGTPRKAARVSSVLTAPTPTRPASQPAGGNTHASGYVRTGSRPAAATVPTKKRPVVSGARPKAESSEPGEASPAQKTPAGKASEHASEHAPDPAPDHTPGHGPAPAAGSAPHGVSGKADAPADDRAPPTPHAPEPSGQPSVTSAVPQAAPAAVAPSRPTRLSEVHSRIAAALAELRVAAHESDPRRGESPREQAARPAARRIALVWPRPRTRLLWPAALPTHPEAPAPPAPSTPAGPPPR